MDGELLMVPGASMAQMIQQEQTAAEDHPKRKPAKKWFRQWVPQDTVLSGKCNLLKWINDDTMSLMQTKHLDEQDADMDYEIVYVCTFDNCGKVFSEAPALRKHAHVHGEKQHICQYEGCGKRFVDSSKLKRHHLIHTGEKHFLCKVCGKAFSLDFNLRSHMRTHTGENYHTCPVEDCGKRYAHEYKLRGHLRSHHDKILPLELETSKVSPAASAAGGGRHFACPHEGCDKRYFYEYKLNLHLKRGHVKEEQNGSEEFSDVSDQDNGLHQQHSGKGSGKGKLRRYAKSPAAPGGGSKKRKTTGMITTAAATTSLNLNQKSPAVDIRLERRSASSSNIKQEVFLHEDSEETEDEGRDDMDELNEGGFEDDEETEDDMD